LVTKTQNPGSDISGRIMIEVRTTMCLLISGHDKALSAQRSMLYAPKARRPQNQTESKELRVNYLYVFSQQSDLSSHSNAVSHLGSISAAIYALCSKSAGGFHPQVLKS
jgi:hypothetical protein